MAAVKWSVCIALIAYCRNCTVPAHSVIKSEYALHYCVEGLPEVYALYPLTHHVTPRIHLHTISHHVTPRIHLHTISHHITPQMSMHYMLRIHLHTMSHLKCWNLQIGRFSRPPFWVTGTYICFREILFEIVETSEKSSFKCTGTTVKTCWNFRQS